MESLSETTWDVIINGTGLQQSLLALSLSRSDKKILHIDPNGYYGGPDAALSLQELDSWAEAHAKTGAENASLFRAAEVTRVEEEGKNLSFARAYSLSLSPQIIHARSSLLGQLVSSRAYRQLEFLAVGSFYIYQAPAADSGDGDGNAAQPRLTRIPSTREAVFSNADIPAKAKRALMKFLKFVLDYDSEQNRPTWKSREDEPLEALLELDFKLDAALRAYVLTLTLAQSGGVTVGDGLATIHRHLTSMGYFGPGFAALYPKWGGASEIAQVACRACAVGGGVYMLGTGISEVRPISDAKEEDPALEVDLDNGLTVKARTLVQGTEKIPEPTTLVSRLVAVIDSPLPSLFEAAAEGAPTPFVAVVAFPKGSLGQENAEYPVYAMAHSSETGECPSGQSVLYLSTLSTPTSKKTLETSLTLLLGALSTGQGEQGAKAIYQLYYEQAQGPPTSFLGDGSNTAITLPPPRATLSLEDDGLAPVRAVWGVLGEKLGVDGGEYMVFSDREGVDDDE